MSKEEPKSREEAYSYQLEDMIKVLKPLSLLGDKKSYKRQLINIQQTINSFLGVEKIRKSNKLQYGDFVMLNDRVNSVCVWSEKKEKQVAGIYTPKKITKEQYYHRLELLRFM